MGTLPKSGAVEVAVEAPPEAVWALLADVTRTGEWSHETYGAEWLDGATAAAPGARFRGRNRSGRTRWSRVCELLEVDPPHLLSWSTVPTALYRDRTIWRFELTPTEGGCRVRQTYEVVKLHPLLDRLFYLSVPAHRDRSEALAADIGRLAEAARSR